VSSASPSVSSAAGNNRSSADIHSLLQHTFIHMLHQDFGVRHRVNGISAYMHMSQQENNMYTAEHNMYITVKHVILFLLLVT